MAQQLTKKLTKHIREGVAMEQTVLRMLESMLKTTDDAELAKALDAHKRVTRQHIERLRQRLEAYGASPSLVKQAGGLVAGRMRVVVDTARRDKVARNARHGFASEQMEVAAYELLEREAKRAGDAETAEVARQNRAEDEAMAGVIARNWDKLAERSLVGGGGGTGRAGAVKARAKGAAGLAQNPIALAAGSVAAGVLIGRRAFSGSQQAEQKQRRGGQPLAQLSKQDLQARAREQGVEVKRSMTKQQLIEALGRRRRSSAGRAKANPVAVQKFLDGVGYPAGKAELVREAEQRGANEQVRKTLARLPRRRFKTPAEVSKAIGKLQ